MLHLAQKPTDNQYAKRMSKFLFKIKKLFIRQVSQN